jgi:diguanylate cyclase (GGDEF)-like protein/PAS domain S-box-containing protein
MPTTVPDWFDAGPGPFLLFERGEIVAATPAACHELDRDEGSILGTALIDRLLPADRTELLAVLESLGPDAEVGPEGRLVIVCSNRGVYADIIELRLHPLATGQVAALVIDASQEQRLDAVVGHLASSTFIVDEGGTMIWRPLGNADRFGIDDADALGASTLEWIHPEDLPQLLRLFTDVISVPGNRITATLRTRQPYVEDGWIHTRITGVNALDDPRVRGVIVRSEEHTEPEIIDSVGHTPGQFNSLADAAPVGILVTDRTGRVIYRNALAQELLGVTTEHWISQARATHRVALAELVAAALDEQRPGSMLAPFDNHAGTRWISINAVPQTDESGRPFGLIATLQDVTAETEAREELRGAQDRLWHLANHDQLTGLPNRSLLMDRMEGALARHRRDGHGVAILYCDLDGFKSVNDEHGHAAGDQVLVEVAGRLTEATRDTDTVCRFGGDEFLVLVESFPDEREVDAVAQRIIDRVAEPMLSVTGARVGITVGISLADGGPVSAGALLARADNAMYRAKARGKGRFEIYS